MREARGKSLYLIIIFNEGNSVQIIENLILVEKSIEIVGHKLFSIAICSVSCFDDQRVKASLNVSILTTKFSHLQ